MAVDTLGVSAWALLLLGAVFVGLAKTAVSGFSTLAVATFALAVPAKESTGALLPLLVVGDLIAVRAYHQHADWRMLARLLPGVVPGLALGVWFLAVADDALVKRSIGVVILLLCALQVWGPRPVSTGAFGGRWHARGGAVLMGVMAGFATMSANAAGPVTGLYLVRAGTQMMAILGTAAWFYLIVNVTKMPFSAGAQLITWPGLLVDVILLPALFVGAVVGLHLVRRIDQARFETFVVGLAALSGVLLLV